MSNLSNHSNSSELDIVISKFKQLEYGEPSYIEKNEFLDLINYYLTQNEIKKATKALNFAVEFYPFSYEFELAEAQVLVESGLFIQAGQKLKKLFAKKPTDFGLLMLIGINYAKSGITNKSILFFEKALESLSEDLQKPVLYTISQTFMQIGRYDTASTYLKKAYKIAPDEDIILDLAFCSERTEKYIESENLYNIYLKINPFSKLTWYNLGIVYTHLKKTEKAINSFDFAIAIDPNFSSAIFNKADVLVDTKQYQKAIIELNKVLELEKNNCTAIFLKGVAYFYSDNYSEALSNLKTSLKIQENQHEAWYFLAKIYFKFNKIKRTKKAIFKALNIETINSKYWEFVARIYLLENNFKSADKAFKQAISFEPFVDEYWFSYAEYKEKSKNVKEAISILTMGKKFISDTLLLSLKLKSLRLLNEVNNTNSPPNKSNNKIYSVDKELKQRS